MSTAEQVTTDPKDTSQLLAIVEVLLTLGIVVSCLAIVGPIIDKPGLGLLGSTKPAVDAQISSSKTLTDSIRTALASEGLKTSAKQGESTVVIGQPVIAHFEFTNPSAGVRSIWVASQISQPILVLAGLSLVLKIVRSVRAGDPFDDKNVKRLWALAVLIAGGGFAQSLFSGLAGSLMILRSSAGDLVDVTAEMSFLPLLLGMLVASLAVVWQAGTRMRDDVAGMI